jgi:ubiquinone/menaquinone biosynthesis C-methylase UbiE
MLNNNTDKDWEKFGKEDPYFGVLTDDKFRRSNLTEESKKEFFKSGTDYINFILKNIEHHVDTEYTINRALDFGCGVGRLAIPLAYIAQEVTGVDVSESMLKEAKENCKERSLENVNFVYSDDDLSMLNGKYDFIHSFLVFQHIPAERGEQIFEKLMERLESGGIGVMHFTYAKDYEIKGLIPLIKKYIPLASNFINWVKGKGFFYYGMQMNAYDTNNLLLMIQKANVKNFYTEFTHSEDEFGLMIYFKKPENS